MNGSLKKLRIFVASPSDVANERTRLKSVIEDLNNGLANHLRVVIELKEWSEVAPNMGRGQKVIFDQIPVTTWDLMIGILWLRYGTPSGGENPTESGTHEEFNAAYEMWKQTGKPRIMFYRCTRSPEDITKLNVDDFTKINQFFKGFETGGEHEGLYRTYDSAENFERIVRAHVEKFVIEYSEQVEHKVITPETLQGYAPKIPNNLPRRQAFFGRTREMETVMHAISPADRTWGVLVDGIGGIGKTAIAIEAAYRCKELEVFDAFIFVGAKRYRLEPGGIQEEVSVANTLDEFVNETALALGRQEIPKMVGEGKRRALLNALQEVRALLVYDNLETLSKVDQEELAAWLRFLPQGCKAIITSRRRGGEGGVWLRVEKLDWDAARGIIESEMARDAGLANKLNSVQSRWQELFDETNGSPLALVHTLGLMRVRVRLTFDGALEMLRGNRAVDLQKFIFQEAQKELTGNDETALASLSFFVPSATFDAWMQMANLSRNALETTIDRLSALSLVDVLAGEERYSLHPLTRAFVRDELLTDSNAKSAVDTRLHYYESGKRFAQYYVYYAERYGGSSKNYATFSQFEVEWQNLDAARNWLWKTANVQGDLIGDKEAARMLIDLTRAVERFLRFSNRWDEHQTWNQYAYETARLLNDWSDAGWCARAVAWTLIYRGDIDQAELWAKKCEEAWTRGGSIGQKAIAIKLLGSLAQRRKDYSRAEELFQKALQMRRDLGNEKGVAIMQVDLGELAYERGDYDSAERYYRDGLKWAQENDDKPRQASRMTNLGELALARERWSDAFTWFKQAFEFAQEVGRQDEIARIKKGLARVHEAEGHADLALPLAQDAIKIYERLQHRNLAETRELVDRLEKKMKVEGEDGEK